MSTAHRPATWSDRSARSNHHSRRNRDAALQRAGSITKSIGVACVAAVVVLTVYVSRAFPGHSSNPAASTGGTTGAASPAGTGSSPGTGNSSGAQSGTALSPPSNAPTQVQQQAPVVSGAT